MTLDKKTHDWLRQGGQRALRHSHDADIYDRLGEKRNRSSAAGRKTIVTQLLSPKLDLTPQERGIGNCYGAYFEKAHTGGSTEFLREYVDGGGIGGSGYSEKQAHIVKMVKVAQRALNLAAPLKYDIGAARGNSRPGRHIPIPPEILADLICVHGHTLSSVAIRFQWVVIRGEKLRVPDRQRKHIAEGLRLALSIIGDAWADANMSVPAQFGTVEFD